MEVELRRREGGNEGGEGGSKKEVSEIVNGKYK